jgi:hypothetical protein
MLHATSCRVLLNVFITPRSKVTHDCGDWDGRFVVIALVHSCASTAGVAHNQGSTGHDVKVPGELRNVASLRYPGGPLTRFCNWISEGLGARLGVRHEGIRIRLDSFLMLFLKDMWSLALVPDLLRGTLGNSGKRVTG